VVDKCCVANERFMWLIDFTWVMIFRRIMVLCVIELHMSHKSYMP